MDNQPGSPKPEEPSKPKPVEASGPSFSYLDLDLQSVVFDNGYRYLIFMVRNDYMISIREWDYHSYMSNIFESIQYIQEDGGDCICDQCNPEFTIVDPQVKLTAVKIDAKTEETISEEDKFVPFYEVYELIPHTIVGLHLNNENEEHKR